MILVSFSKKVSNPNGVNLHKLLRDPIKRNVRRFKPQRGKFTPTTHLSHSFFFDRFKPQRGKFTHSSRNGSICAHSVSNPNGVNLHSNLQLFLEIYHQRFKPQRGKFTLKFRINQTQAQYVSNPNGVNLHATPQAVAQAVSEFQTPTG